MQYARARSIPKVDCKSVNHIDKIRSIFAFRAGAIFNQPAKGPSPEVRAVWTCHRIFASLFLVLMTDLPAFAVSADSLLIEGLSEAQATAGQRPTRGMSMEKVTTAWGDPVSKSAAVGQPPITAWEYPGFTVYFEYEHVIHAVVKHGV